jgi:peptide/nickel transport system substrate-binding protein
MASKIDRRTFLKGAATAAVSILAASCAQPTPQVVEKEVPVEKVVKETVVVEKEVAVEKVVTATTEVSQYNEPPMLVGLVKDGQLPPVDERVPSEPLIVTPIEQVGEYGGTWHRLAVGPNDIRTPDRLMYDQLVRWNIMGNDLVPNVAKSWEVSKDGTTFTFDIRRGIKWSDGEPFTAEDIAFYMVDHLGNEEIAPSFPGWLESGDTPVDFELLDDYTVQFTFAEPYGLFMPLLASAAGQPFALYPKHYLEQYHVNYTDKAELQAAAEEAGFEEWYQYYSAKGGNPWSASKNLPEFPVIHAWKIKVPPPKQPVVLERNPYFWKVDTEGNQLPYIDRIEHMIVGDSEILNQRAIAGEVDMQHRHIDFTNYSLYKESAAQAGYRVLEWQSSQQSEVVMHPNVAHADPVMREIIGDKRFRWALSLGLNRAEISEAATLGLGVPTQASPLPSSPLYGEEQATTMTDYDPGRANELLDEMGLTERDGEGFRLRPDGERLSMVFEYVPGWGDDTVQLAAEHWKALGLDVSPKEEARPLLTERTYANEHDLVTWPQRSAFGYAPLINPADFIPFSRDPSKWAVPYADWYQSGGETGEEPPEVIKEAQSLYDEITRTASADQQEALFRQILEIAAENLWVIGNVTKPPALIIVKDDFRNVPEMSISSWELMTPGNTMPEQYFIRS